MRRTTRFLAALALTTGFLTTGEVAQAQFEFRPGQYYQGPNGARYNPTTGSTHVPNQAVIKPSGVYTPIGNGYYQNPNTGNVYNPYTRSYTR